MTEQNVARSLADFDAAIAVAATPAASWHALETLGIALVGAKLFTVMTVDKVRELAGRVYTSDPASYPVSGTKPIRYDDWFDLVHRQRKPFIANTIADIAKVFPDHETIRSLGCGSVINVPIEIGGDMVGTVNLLHQEHFYDAARVERSRLISLPAKTAFLAAAYLQG